MLNNQKPAPVAGFSFYWHDYETFGIDPHWARPAQFAGVRTDADLNIIGEPLTLYCQPATDTLPDPESCLITGITPQHCQQLGLPEHEFTKKIHAELSVPGTCAVGFNSIRFDDEFTRHLLYRNFYDPYEREWKHGNSRWDILDVLRLMHALRPDGMAWPASEEAEDKGRPVFKLEALTRANKIEHVGAHDALSDVMATIAVAKKMKQAQPRLFDYALTLRDKREVAKLVDLKSHKPLFHVSSRLQWQHGYAALVMPLCPHPTNSNGIICYDLSVDPSPLLRLSSDEIAERVFTKTQDLPEGMERVSLKTIHLNKSPMIASLAVLDENVAQRLHIDRALCEKHWQLLMQHLEEVCGKVSDVMGRDAWQDVVAVPDPEFRLYSGFLSAADRQLCERVRRCSGAELAGRSFPFADTRMQELLFRYRARNFPESLSKEEQHQWEEYRYQRLNEKLCEGYMELESYHSKIAMLAARSELDVHSRQILVDLEQWAEQIL
jgi:exodeoxyribonuclease-1